MKLLALAAVSLSTLALAACPAKKSTNDPIANTGDKAPPADDPSMTDGALWTCQIGDYDPQPCKLSKDGEGWRLAKLLGSQRFKGTATWSSPDAIDFAGQFHCPWGSCDEPMNVTFKRDANDFKADFSSEVVSLRWDAALAAEWGGAGYGNLTGDEQ